MSATGNAKTHFTMPDADVTVTPIWNHMYLNITNDGAVSASDKLKAMTADTPIDLVIPSEINGIKVSSIDNSAFSNCKSLTSVVIPDTVTKIGNDAFSMCANMSSVTIKGVDSIGSRVFAFCTKLKSVDIPGSIRSIDSLAFGYCTTLTTINIYKPKDSITLAPWGCKATVNWLG